MGDGMGDDTGDGMGDGMGDGSADGEQWSVRGATEADVDVILDIAVRVDVEEFGQPDYTAEDAAADLREAGRTTWLAVGPDGPAAVAWVTPEGHESVSADVWCPSGTAPSVGPALVRLVRDESARRMPGVPVRSYVAAPNRAKAGWYAEAGFRSVRRFSRMLVELDDLPPTPAARSDVELTRGCPDDARATYHRVMNTAFTNHFDFTPLPFDRWWERQSGRSGFDPDLWWLARLDGAPAAALIGRAMPDMAWVQGLGTLPQARGRGLGTLLLHTFFRAAHERGWRQVGLGVDTDNETGALRLYESVGMRPAQQWAVYEATPSPPPRDEP